MQITIEELAMLLGQKDIEIFSLQKRILELQNKLEEKVPESK